MVKPLKVGDKVVSKLKATYGKEGRKEKYCRFREVQGAESTLLDGVVEQLQGRQQRVYPTPTHFNRSNLHSHESAKPSDPP